MKTKNEDKSRKDTVTPITKISSKVVSQFYVKMKFVAPNAEKRMKNECFDEETILLIHSIPSKVTEDTRLAIFEFKITLYTPLIPPCPEMHLSRVNSAISLH